MRRHPVVPLSVRSRAVIALAALSIAACTGKERGADSAGAGASTGAAAGASAAAQSAAPAAAPNALATRPGAAAPLPGELTKPIDQYTGDEFFALVQRLRWSGGVERDRKCKGDPQCDGTNPSRRTRVRVDAVDGQDSISATSVATNGVVTIRAINRGNLDEDRYGFKPNRRLEYYLIVLPGNAAAGRWQLEELDTTPGARRHASVGTGTFRPCNHPFRPRRTNRANFFTCTESALNDSVQTSGLALFAVATDPLWTDCAQGCCLAD